MKVEYDEDTHASLLVHMAWNGVHNKIMEFVEREQPHLLKLDYLGKWKKPSSTLTTLWRTLCPERVELPPQTNTSHPVLAIPPHKRCKHPLATLTGSSAATVHPNALRTFGGQGILMDLAKAQAEGKCQWCSKPWPCKEHFKPHINPICMLKFHGVTFSYKNETELQEILGKIELDFANRFQ